MKLNNLFNGASLSNSSWLFDRSGILFKDTVNQPEFFAKTRGFNRNRRAHNKN